MLRFLWLTLIAVSAAAQIAPTLIDPTMNEREDAFMTRQAGALLGAARDTFLKYPPQYPEPEQRRAALLLMDGVLHDKYAAQRPPVQEFFHGQMRNALDDLKNSPAPAEGAVIYKLYNMGYIVRTSSVTIAFDVTNASSSRVPEFRLPHEMMKEALDKCDVLFISHRHDDHTDKAVAQMFIDAGKPVVAPPQVWATNPIGPSLTRLRREAHTVQPLKLKSGIELKVVVYPGHQMSQTENNVTLVITPEGSFCHMGDQINEGDFMEDYAWIDVASKHQRVDVLMPNCWTNEIYRIVKGFDPKLVLPGHQNELGHDIDDRVPYWGDNDYLNLTYKELLASSYPVIVMTWGERYHYVPSPVTHP